MNRATKPGPRIWTPTLALIAFCVAGAASAGKFPPIKVDDDPSVGNDDAPVVLIEFGHHL